jgi:aspartokinase-like uncharacterized kinase
MIVVKVGGSLFDHPALGPALREFVASLAPAEVMLVPGGGPVADAVRQLDQVHGLGEEAAHWLALRALSVTGAFLERLARPAPPTPLPVGRGEKDLRSSLTFDDPTEACRAFTPSLQGGGWGVGLLTPFTFAQEDDSRPGALPHSWSVTTDSIAARAAVVYGAERLILLKSVDIPPEISWETAAANGWVDAHFPRIAATLTCPISVINFRRKLETHA